MKKSVWIFFEIITLIILVFTPMLFAEGSQQNTSGPTTLNIKNLIDQYRKGNETEKNSVLRKLHYVKPITEEDVNSLVGAIHEGDPDLQTEATNVLMNVSSYTYYLRGVYTKLLDDNSEKIQLPAIKVCSRLNIKESAPKILKLLSGRPRRRFLGMYFGGLTAEELDYAAESVRALANLDYFPAIDEILSRDELMCISGLGGPEVANYGAKAIPKILELIRKNDKRKNGGIQAIAYMRDEQAVPELVKLLNDSDQELVNTSASALSEMTVKSENYRKLIVEALEKLTHNPDGYIRGHAYAGLIRHDPKTYLPIVFNAIRKDEEVRLDVFYALIKNPAPESVPFLEEFIREDEKQEPNWWNTRSVAAQAIYKMTGRRVHYKGVEEQLELYDRGIREDPYNPSGPDGLHFKKQLH